MRICWLLPGGTVKGLGRGGSSEGDNGGSWASMRRASRTSSGMRACRTMSSRSCADSGNAKVRVTHWGGAEEAAAAPSCPAVSGTEGGVQMGRVTPYTPKGIVPMVGDLQSLSSALDNRSRNRAVSQAWTSEEALL